jgi:hypothetical protein
MTPDFSQLLETLGAAFLAGFTGLVIAFVIIFIVEVFTND